MSSILTETVKRIPSVDAREIHHISNAFLGKVFLQVKNAWG
jgi:hypothetical protein